MLMMVALALSSMNGLSVRGLRNSGCDVLESTVMAMLRIPVGCSHAAPIVVNEAYVLGNQRCNK